LAVVAYDYAAAADLFRGRDDGLMVPVADEPSFAALAAGLAQDRTRMKVMGGRAREIALAQDWRHINDTFVRLLRLAAKRHQRTRDAHAKLVVAVD